MKTSSTAHGISVLLIGGQGTYLNGRYYTEWPDRDSAVLHAANATNVISAGRYTHVVCCGGFTQRQTPTLSEASSFLNMWEETQTRPMVQIVLDEVSLDSTENIIHGLMALRREVPDAPIRRVAYYSLWQFKKPRMVGCARDLGILEQFYFHAYADHTLAWAHDKARAGEIAQCEKLVSTQDFLLLGKEWEEKRRKRYCGPDYGNRTQQLRETFPTVFRSLDALCGSKANELLPFIHAQPDNGVQDVVQALRERKLGDLRAAVQTELIKG